MAQIQLDKEFKNYQSKEKELKEGLGVLQKRFSKLVKYNRKHKLEDVLQELGERIKPENIVLSSLIDKEFPAYIFISPEKGQKIIEIDLPKKAKGVGIETIMGTPQLYFGYRGFVFHIQGFYGNP